MPELYTFQRDAVEAFKRASRHRWIFNLETGLGKTPAAITAVKELAYDRILVVTPALVRTHWVREWARWWPDKASEIAALTIGRNRKSGVSKRGQERRDQAYRSNVQVVSYALVGDVDPRGPDGNGWDCIILDELHRLQSWKSKQSKDVRAITDVNPQAAILGLTATLMPNDIIDLWHQLDTLWPGNWGRQTNKRYAPWAFTSRYCNQVENVDLDTGERYGIEWKGINAEHAAELKTRLARVSTRITKAEVAHLLPPFLVTILRVRPDKQVRFQTLQDWEEGNGLQKLPFVLDWLEDALKSNTHVFIATHLKATARKLSEACASLGNVVLVTGDETPEQRNAILDKAKASPGAILIGTMHAVGIGISLTFCTAALLAELYPRPETVIQFLGRFSRLDSSIPSSVSILCLEGTVDERMANIVFSKIEAINQATPAGTADSKLQEAINIQHTDEEVMASLGFALEGIQEDVYG